MPRIIPDWAPVAFEGLCEVSGFSPEDILSESRTSEVVEARQRIMLALWKGHLNDRTIGAIMRRDRTTVRSGRLKAEKLIEMENSR